MLQKPERLIAIRHNQGVVAPRHSSRRIAALIAQIARDGSLPPQEEVGDEQLRQAAGV